MRVRGRWLEVWRSFSVSAPFFDGTDEHQLVDQRGQVFLDLLPRELDSQHGFEVYHRDVKFVQSDAPFRLKLPRCFANSPEAARARNFAISSPVTNIVPAMLTVEIQPLSLQRQKVGLETPS